MLALAMQIFMTQIVEVAPTLALVGLHLASYAIVGVALWANRALPGLLVLMAGALTNAAVITLNGGTLPASAHALRQAGLSLPPGRFTNSGVVGAPVLSWLGDIVATPAWLPFRNVISVGDMLILIGAAILLHTICRSRLAPVPRRPPAAPGIATAKRSRVDSTPVRAGTRGRPSAATTKPRSSASPPVSH